MEEERTFRVRKKHLWHPIFGLALFLLATILITILTQQASIEFVDHVRSLYDLGGGLLGEQRRNFDKGVH